MGAHTGVTFSEVRALVADLAAAMQVQGAAAAASILGDAAAEAGGGSPDDLLELRSALVRTRAEWDVVADEELLATARRVLAAAKRLAIDL